ncbi:hypothetical protein LJC53_07335, partial [Bacteroidales bacterium OttesenSCG-928-C03]|nr:hypothetical protein [Bacteroidales bacterium OttesenSCG-928-C03]
AANANAQNAFDLTNRLLETLNNQLLRVLVISEIILEPKTTTTVDLKESGVTVKNLVDVIAFNGDKDRHMAIIREGVSFSIRDTILFINSTATMVVTIKILYNFDFELR